ncbi:MAG: GDSL-type esterase/lipase family protein [Nannocystaceae bacterium]
MSKPPSSGNPHTGLLDVEEGEHDTIVLQGSNRGARVEPGSFVKLASALAVFALAIVGTYTISGLEWAQPWSADEAYIPYWNIVGREFMGEGAEADQRQQQAEGFAELARQIERDEDGERDKDKDGERDEDGGDDEAAVAPDKDAGRSAALQAAPQLYPEYREHADDSEDGGRGTELAYADKLGSFFRALTHTDLGIGGSITRAAHWGDSVLGNDGITAAIRSQMQARFGDAGHGFHALAQYDPSYRHKGVIFREKSKWSKCYIIAKCMKSDGRYGYGGTTVWSAGGAESVFSTTTKGRFGRRVSRFEVWYLAGPKGGKLRVRLDKQDPQIIDTRAEAREDRWRTFEVPDGAHRFSLRAAGGGRARAYGVVLERPGPGVVWDGMALIGAFTNRMNELDSDHFRAQIAHRDPDLLVFMFGGNDMIRVRAFRESMDLYEREYVEVIRRARGPAKDRACLIMSAIDHGERRKGRVVTRAIVPRMVAAQRRVAHREGCAFFDTYEAMGGAGSMAIWSKMEPRLASGDLAHPTHHGHKVLGKLFYGALMRAYATYRRELAGTAVVR